MIINKQIVYWTWRSNNKAWVEMNVFTPEITTMDFCPLVIPTKIKIEMRRKFDFVKSICTG